MTNRSLHIPSIFTALALLIVSGTASARFGATLTDRIGEYPSLSTLSLALEVSGLDHTFDGRKTYSIYGPSNRAFEDVAGALGCEDVLELANGLVATDLLVPVLQVHASPGRKYLSRILRTDKLPTLSPDFPTIQSGLGTNGVSLAADGNDPAAPPEIIVPNQSARNGVLQIINAVLLPVDAGTVNDALENAGYCI